VTSSADIETTRSGRTTSLGLAFLTHVSPSFSFDTPGGGRRVDTTFDTHHVVVGVSFRF
jgi:hypothetical protein